MRNLIVWLVRHAESTANVDGALEHDDDAPLTPRGRAQSEALVARLAGVPVDAIHTSDVQRARDTVAPLAAALGITPVATPQLREPQRGRRSESYADEETVARLLAHGASTPRRSTRTETHAEVVARLRQFANELIRSDGANVLVCSHFVTLNTLVRLLIEPGDPPAEIWTRFDNASITCVELPERRVGAGRLRRLNDLGTCG